MPSPFSHTLIGASLGIGYAVPRARLWRDLFASLRVHWKPVLLAALFANAPDVDYVPGILTGDLNAFHHYYTHSLGWILLVSVGTWLCLRAFRREASWGLLVFLFALLVSHLVADWLTEDGRAPYGIMAFWPFSSRYFITPYPVLPRWLKTDWGEIFQFYNLKAAFVEVARVLPVLIAVVLYKRFRPAAQRRGGSRIEG
ncbi:MAG: metal-dependent hydrolase [Kiritimatiellae bacterium]|nr:metal-dependent hydrolase [Kiritimatiellia bacterium]